MPCFERDVIRPHVLGHFKDLVLATARHPAMLYYLDNFQSISPNAFAIGPFAPIVDALAKQLARQAHGLNVRAVMAVMFSSPEFLSEGAWQAKIKSPLEMVVSAVRALHSEVNDTFTLVQKIADLGEPLYAELEPTGYSDAGSAWLSTGSLLSRMNFATALAAGQIPGVKRGLGRLGSPWK